VADCKAVDAYAKKFRPVAWQAFSMSKGMLGKGILDQFIPLLAIPFAPVWHQRRFVVDPKHRSRN
jgi:hypothetical protein